MQADVVVVGAGFTGLVAARTLAAAGKQVVLVEARNRLGGRAWSVIEKGVPIELGAEFVHGKPPVLLSLLQEAGVPYFELDGKFYRVQNGRIAADDYGSNEDGDGAFDVLKHLPATAQQDASFQQAARQANIPADQMRWLTRYVEGFNAADATRISAASLALQQNAEEAIDGDTSFRLTHGYTSLVNWLADECERLGVQVHREMPVRSVLWKPGEVIVVADAQEFHAQRCVVTLPLGVLKAGVVQFQPEPVDFFSALKAVEVGNARRISLLFRTRFWQNQAPAMSFLINGQSGEAQGDRDLNAWWTPNPSPAPLITGWAGGPRALDFVSGEEMLAAALRSLARYFQTTEQALHQQLVAWHSHDWHNDPYSLGAYSYVASGGLPKLPVLSEPVGGTLYFAGEHTEQDGHWGTVHAALSSGLRAADQILTSTD